MAGELQAPRYGMISTSFPHWSIFLADPVFYTPYEPQETLGSLDEDLDLSSLRTRSWSVSESAGGGELAVADFLEWHFPLASIQGSNKCEICWANWVGRRVENTNLNVAQHVILGRERRQQNRGRLESRALALKRHPLPESPL